MGRWFVTPHAVARYRDRVLPYPVSYATALARIIYLSARAHLVRVRPDGIEDWRCGRRDGRIRFRVQPARGAELPQLLTVLPGCEVARR
jgi:hypothetical protein